MQNEVMATIAIQKKGKTSIHPNDDVNMSQSSNDVIPTAIHISALLDVEKLLLPSLKSLINQIKSKELKVKGVVKNWQNSSHGCYAHRFGARTIRMG